MSEEQLSEMITMLGEAITPVIPPPAVKMRVLATVMKAMLHLWVNIPIPGIAISHLFADERSHTVSLLMKLHAGAVYPAHDHHGAEESFAVSGSCRIGDLMLAEGGYYRIEAGGHHGNVISDEGCFLLLTVDEKDYRAT